MFVISSKLITLLFLFLGIALVVSVKPTEKNTTTPSLRTSGNKTTINILIKSSGNRTNSKIANPKTANLEMDIKEIQTNSSILQQPTTNFTQKAEAKSSGLQINPIYNSPDALNRTDNSSEIKNYSDDSADKFSVSEPSKGSLNQSSNITEGFDSFLIKENINAFTNVSSECPKCKCGVRTLKRIVGGSVTARNEFPWIALLTYNQKFFCGANLINDRYVVTAGHCTTTFPKEQILVHLREYKKDAPNEEEIITRRVSNVFRPISFNPSNFNSDISLLKLEIPVDISSGLIRPICLPVDRTSFVGKIGSVTGWAMKNENGFSSRLVRKINVTILSNRQCRMTQVGKLISSTEICATASKTENISECRGDSGSPLMITQKGRSRLAGIVSWGLGCGKKNAADVFTRTTKFNGWIRNLSQGACWCN